MAKVRLSRLQQGRIRDAWMRGNVRSAIRDRIRSEYGADVNSLRDLLALIVEYGPQVLQLVMQVISLFK